MTDEPASLPIDATSTQRWRRVALVAAKILVVLLGIWLAIAALRQVNWAQVGDGLGRLVWWEILVVALIVMARQVVNASTLLILLPGLRFSSALSTALSGTLIQTLSPPPADTVLRLSILRSYNIETTRGAAVLVLDTVVFYIARFVAPIVGLVLALWALPLEPIQIWMAVGGAAAAAVLIGSLAVISKGEQIAGRFGRRVGELVKRLRSSIDPEAWAVAMTRFQRESATGMARRIGLATPTMLGFVAVDCAVLVACLRFVGVPGSDIGYLAVLAALLCLYPLTVFPFAGLGVLDASLIVLINAEGIVAQPDLVAALVIWRAATLLLPLIPGLVALIYWRTRQGTSA
ncbi:lysylphosphatidylglycerol synthase-like protein [Antricoccus suffuscus]|uniref:Lysylphosphatidylglycerol synthase-like protein n=1 Tax=Antricoccus suffuscus TaxID=1629062 RepID=A0A2T0ZFT0_9ACTN|nr:lysylphosphatidylglycerol synthase domain-containing protein [Antricoccus suffuscus]PRZ35210.1 lysylphosphatidylglycerol synthase-like protein [Antricoccus suffuscus]